MIIQDTKKDKVDTENANISKNSEAAIKTGMLNLLNVRIDKQI